MLAAVLPSRFARDRDVRHVPHGTESPRQRYWALTCGIDYFRSYYDIYGHMAGEDVQRRIEERLVGACQGQEQVFRRSGAEYVIILTGDGLDQVRQRAESHREAVESLQIPHQGSPLGIVTVSMGLAAIVAGGPQATVEALGRAEDALDRAKQSGRNQVAAAGSLIFA